MPQANAYVLQDLKGKVSSHSFNAKVLKKFYYDNEAHSLLLQ